MGIKQDLRRAAGLAVVLGGIAVPCTAQAQVSVEADAGLAQVSTSQSATGLAVGDAARAGTGNDATSVDLAGVTANVAQDDLRAGVGPVAGVAMDQDLTVAGAGVDVVVDDKVVGARSGAAAVGADVRRGAGATVDVDTDALQRPVRRAAGRTVMRTCRTLSRRQARGLKLNRRQVRVLAGCRSRR